MPRTGSESFTENIKLKVMKKLIYIVPCLLFFAAACSEDPGEPQGQGDG